MIHYDYTEKLSLVLQKAQRGEEITIGFLGGSITQGCNPSVPENAYAYRVYKWLEAFVSPTPVTYINAGIGATGSLIGVHRVEEDLLQYKPDIIIVEFAANDVSPTESTSYSYESIIRRIIKVLPDTAIVELFMTLQDGTSAYAQQTQIGHHYKVPMVSFRERILSDIASGVYIWEDLETDEVHPNDRGHALVEELICDLFEGAAKKEVNKDYTYILPEKVLFSDKYIDGRILNHNNFKALTNGSFVPVKEGFKTLNSGWMARMEEDNQSFICKVSAKNIILLYRRNLGVEQGKAEVVVDHNNKIIVDSSFDKGWGDYAETVILLEEDGIKEHIIEVKLLDGKKDETFTILGLLVS